MLSASPQLDWLPDDLRESVNEFVALLAALAGRNLLGLTGWGPALSGDDTAAPLSTVAVLERIDLEMLRRLAEHGPALARQRLAAPLIMTPESIAASRDSFPLELLEIHQFHATLHGRDYFDSIDINREHARLQVEREFRRVLVRLRQGLLASAGRDARLVELIEDVAEHMLRTLRGLLWVRGAREPLPRTRVLSEIEQLAGRPLPGLRGAAEIKRIHDWNEFTALYRDVEQLAAIADETR